MFRKKIEKSQKSDKSRDKNTSKFMDGEGRVFGKKVSLITLQTVKKKF
jgi:hypothetical protein